MKSNMLVFSACVLVTLLAFSHAAWAEEEQLSTTQSIMDGQLTIIQKLDEQIAAIKSQNGQLAVQNMLLTKLLKATVDQKERVAQLPLRSSPEVWISQSPMEVEAASCDEGVCSD